MKRKYLRRGLKESAKEDGPEYPRYVVKHEDLNRAKRRALRSLERRQERQLRKLPKRTPRRRPDADPTA